MDSYPPTDVVTSILHDQGHVLDSDMLQQLASLMRRIHPEVVAMRNVRFPFLEALSPIAFLEWLEPGRPDSEARTPTGSHKSGDDESPRGDTGSLR